VVNFLLANPNRRRLTAVVWVLGPCSRCAAPLIPELPDWSDWEHAVSTADAWCSGGNYRNYREGRYFHQINTWFSP